MSVDRRPVAPILHPNGQHQFGGLTIREHYAAAAMQGMFASGLPLSAQQIANAAFHAADLMIETSRQTQETTHVQG